MVVNGAAYSRPFMTVARPDPPRAPTDVAAPTLVGRRLLVGDEPTCGVELAEDETVMLVHVEEVREHRKQSSRPPSRASL